MTEGSTGPLCDSGALPGSGLTVPTFPRMTYLLSVPCMHALQRSIHPAVVIRGGRQGFGRFPRPTARFERYQILNRYGKCCVGHHRAGRKGDPVGRGAPKERKKDPRVFFSGPHFVTTVCHQLTRLSPVET